MHFCRVSSFEYVPRGRGGAVGGFKGFDLLGRRWGVDISTVYVGTERYLDRWILYINGYTLRLHRFWRGDDDRASHTHPWWFVTFPLTRYVERRFVHGQHSRRHVVAAWRPHYRAPNFEHYVMGAPKTPWWTIVLTGPKRDTWGFYPFDKPGIFVKWTEYD